MRKPRPLRLKIPVRTPAPVRFCDGSPDAIAAWIGTLPRTDAALVCRSTIDALTQLYHAESDAATRLRQLETLRPAATAAGASLAHLARSGAPGGIDARRRRALAAQTLSLHLATGYKLVILDALRAGARGSAQVRPGSPGAVLVTAVHRATTELSRLLLRALQLYAPAPPRLWDELHQFYLLAEAQGFADLRITDPEQRHRRQSTIAEAYTRAILLAAAQPNSLRHEPIQQLFDALEDWTRFTRITPPGDGDPRVIRVDLAGDEPPVQARLHRPGEDEDPRLIDSRALVRLLTESLGTAAGRAATERTPARPEGLSDDLVRHCIRAWTGDVRRVARRTPASGRFEVCLGLAAVHFHAGGGVAFEAQLGIPRQSLAVLDDGFADATVFGSPRLVDRGSAAASHAPDEHRLHRVELVDAGPGGFGIEWDDVPSEALQIGELIGLREGADHHWGLGIVRWLSTESDDIRAGIEMIAPRLLPAGVRLRGVRDARSDWVRALRIPAMEVLGQPALLITPPLPFRTGHKVALHEDGETQEVRLETLRVTSPGFSVFEYRPIEGLLPATETGIVKQDVGGKRHDIWASVTYRR
ncbi:MAG: hypothetical protein V2I63_02035 [Pseudomonadales bacterium]|jgi:hypothetical protein|nr:hypothetical protein [Pseudomonadales bacterium]